MQSGDLAVGVHGDDEVVLSRAAVSGKTNVNVFHVHLD
jgi:UDP-N-acetylglucosamine 2-epimerase